VGGWGVQSGEVIAMRIAEKKEGLIGKGELKVRESADS